MPVKLGSKFAPESAEARIEIIPLIDIMFFLLAAFMLVSLSMVNVKSVRVNLPTATAARPEAQRDFTNISVDKGGLLFLEGMPVGSHELVAALSTSRATNLALRVLISGDKEARHGDVMRALELVRATGIDQVAFEVRQPRP